MNNFENYMNEFISCLCFLLSITCILHILINCFKNLELIRILVIELFLFCLLLYNILDLLLGFNLIINENYKSNYCYTNYWDKLCISGDNTSDQISKLISHRAQHLDESVYQCSFCSFKCRLKQNFLSHLKMHTPDKTFKCDSCTKSFRFKQNLESHMLTHSPDKTLSCETCGFHTKFLSHMIAHKRIHTGKF